MKQIKLFSLAALLMAGAAFTACSSDNDIIDEQQNVNANGKYTLTIKAGKGTTRALAIGDVNDDGKDDIIATWEAGDPVDVYNGKEYVGTLQAQSSGSETTLTGEIEGDVWTGDVLTLKSAKVFYYTEQDGTLDWISKKGEYFTASVTVAGFSDDNIIPEASTTVFENQQAIVKFVLTNMSVDADFFSITISGHEDSYVVDLRENPRNEFFVALPAFSNKTVELFAEGEGHSYYYGKENVTLNKGEYYTITVKMNQEY